MSDGVPGGCFFRLDRYYNQPSKAREKAGRKRLKKYFCSIAYRAGPGSFADLVEAGHAGILDTVILGPISKRRKGLEIGARHPHLAAQRNDLVEQRSPAQRVEVGRNLIQQKERRRPVATLADEI